MNHKPSRTIYFQIVDPKMIADRPPTKPAAMVGSGIVDFEDHFIVSDVTDVVLLYHQPDAIGLVGCQEEFGI